MKKSELTAFIKEEIKSSLTSEDTQQDIKDTEELTKAVADLAKAKEEAGLSEENIGLADLEEVGYTDGDKAVAMHFNHDVVGINNDVDFQAYRKGFIQGVNDATIGFSLNEEVVTENDYETGGYVESMGPLFDKGVNLLIRAWEEWKMGPMTEPGMIEFAKKDVLEYLKTQFIEENLEEASYANQYVDKNRIASNKYKQANDYKASYDSIGQVSSEKQFDDDNIDKKAVKGAKKNKGLAKTAEELALLTREMKSLAKKYSKAEGEEKEELVKTLKAKTKLKKELESILDKKKI